MCALLLVREGPYSLEKMTRGIIYNESDMTKPLFYTIENPGSGAPSSYYGGVKNKIVMAASDVLGKCIPEGKYSIYDFMTSARFGLDAIKILPKGWVSDTIGLMLHPGDIIIDKVSWDTIQKNHGDTAKKVLSNYLTKNKLAINLDYSHSKGCILVSVEPWKFNEDNVVYGTASYAVTGEALKKAYNNLSNNDRNLKIINSLSLKK